MRHLLAQALPLRARLGASNMSRMDCATSGRNGTKIRRSPYENNLKVELQNEPRRAKLWSSGFSLAFLIVVTFTSGRMATIGT
jgi:hypothetical protein